VLVSDFHFHLPEELIAQTALEDRAASRMLCLDRRSGAIRDGAFRELPELLRGDDLVVFNNTRVFPARLFATREGADGKIEVFLTRQVSAEPNEWECLVRPGRKVRVGARLSFGDELQGEVIAAGEFGERRVRFEVTRGKIPTSAAKNAAEMGHPDSSTPDFFSIVERIGHVPLPPYISRQDSAGDRERYQTVYARERGSVAAPTAGLHFTPETLEKIRARGIETAEVTLHVGLGTFQPVRVEKVEEHRLHAESYSISEETGEKIRRAKKHGRRVVAVGTTTVRTLEFAVRDGELRAGSGEAGLVIYPGFSVRVVDALLTNFHLPESTLLMLVCALGGKENVMRAYAHAVEQRYRFYSYGDCMLVE